MIIVTAANAEFYLPLQATVFCIHQKFPNNHLIIYDLGLDEDMRKKVKYFLDLNIFFLI